jgi:LysR family transcriptional regulator, transcriptional activator of the cysJI operon
MRGDEMDFKQIEAFVNVVKQHSFSKAGEALNLTQPTISAHISSLEKELGLRLIDRGRKETLPTKEGAVFYGYAVNMLQMRDESIYSLDSGKGEYDGTLDLLISSGICDSKIPESLAKFKKRFPNIALFVRQEQTAWLLKKIADGRAAFGFTDTMQDDGLEYELLKEERFVLIVPNCKAYAENVERSMNLFELRKEFLITWECSNSARKPILKVLADAGLLINQRRVVAVLDSIEAVKQYVRNGLGAAILPESAAKEGSDARLLVFSIDDLSVTNKLYLVYNKANKLSPEATAFLSFIQGDTIRGSKTAARG